MKALGLPILLLACAVSAQTLQSVHSFGPLKIGGSSPVQPGDPTAYPHKITPRAKFYVLIVERGLPTMCTFEDCGPEGALVEKLGGWVTGDTQNETIHLARLDQTEVKAGRQSIVIVSDKTARIVGIYPNSKMRHLPEILEALGFSAKK